MPFLHLSSCAVVLCIVLLAASSAGQIESIPKEQQLGLLAPELQECCQYLTKYEKLVLCVNSTLGKSTSDVISQIPYMNGQLGPRLAVGLVTRATRDIFAYSSYSLFVQSVYAASNNYALFPLIDDDLSKPDYQYHRKLVPILHALNSSHLGYHFDYLIWMDADAIPLDLSIRFERIAASYPQAHILMSADVSSLANTGVMIIRNTIWARNFLFEWLAQHETSRDLTDQHGLQRVFDLRISKMKLGGGANDVVKKIALLPPHVLNSEAPPMGRQKDTHKVLHLAAESTDMRRRAFRTATEDLCRTIKTQGRTPLSPQLGVHRQQLLQAAKESYGHSSKKLLYALIEAPDMSTINDLGRCRIWISKYSHAIKYLNDEAETIETLSLRKHLHIFFMYIVRRMLASQECRILQQKEVEVLNDSKDGNNKYQEVVTGRDWESTSNGHNDYSSSDHDDDNLIAALFQDVRNTELREAYEANGGSGLNGAVFPSETSFTFKQSSACVSSLENLVADTDLPELIKMSCEASYDYFQALSSINSLPPSLHRVLFYEDEVFSHLEPIYFVDRENLHNNLFMIQDLRLSIGSYIEKQLQRLLDMVGAKQTGLIIDMYASLLSDMGLIKLEQGHVEDSLKFFQEANKLYESLSIKFGGTGDKKAEYNAMSLEGSALCMHHKYEDGLAGLERAIYFETKHLGPSHHNLGTKLVNAAICSFDGYTYLSEQKQKKREEGMEMEEEVAMKKKKYFFLDKSRLLMMEALRIIDANLDIAALLEMKTLAESHLMKIRMIISSGV